MKLLEELIRGKTLNKSNDTTKLFALMYQKQLEIAGCLGLNKELLMENYREALNNENLDINLLCSAVGEEVLDERFMQM